MNIITRTLLSVFAVSISMTVASNAVAQNEGELSSDSKTFPEPRKVELGEPAMRPHIGVVLGVANPEGSYDAAPEFGLDIGFQPYIPFGIGATLTTSRNTSRTSASDLERTSLLAKGTYNFGGTTPVIRHSWVGVAAGPVFHQDGTDLGIAPVVGFDIPLRDDDNAPLSLGADAKYLTVTGDESAALSVNAIMKYWY